MIKWLRAVFDVRTQQPREQCSTCRYFEDWSAEDPEEPTGYCAHPDHFNPKKSPHSDYGGHWTASHNWCSWWAAP